MSRIVIQWRDGKYRLASAEQGNDGSLMLFFKAIKISCHTTGEIRYYTRRKLIRSIFYDPLYDLSESIPIAMVYLTDILELDSVIVEENDAIIDLPDEYVLPATFEFHIANDREQKPNALKIDYVAYGLLVSTFSQPPTDIGFSSRCFMPDKGKHNARRMDPVIADIEYHQKVYGTKELVVFLEPDGSYMLVTRVPMRIAPELIVHFDKKGIRAVVDKNFHRAHKLRFWLEDKHGRNRTGELSQHITQIMLSAEL